MVGNEANLCPSIARQLVQLVHEGVAEGAQVACLQGRSRHVEQEQVDGRLGRPQHVLLWRYKLYRRRLALRPSTGVTVAFADRVIEEFLRQLIHSIAKVAAPPTLVDEMDEGVDISAAGAAPDYGGALDDRQVGEVFEGVDEHAQRQPRLLQQGLRLGNLGQGRPENLRAAVGIVPLLGLKAWLWWRHLLGGKDVPVLKQVQAFLAPHLLEPILCDAQTSQLEKSCFVTLMLYC